MSNTNIEILEKNLVRVTVTISAEKFEEGINLAYNKKKGTLSVPGFRKGKVPKAMIEKQYGKEFFYEDAINFVFPDEYEKALIENKIVPVSRPTLEQPKITETEVTISALVFKKPEVTVSNYKGVEIEKVPTEASEEDVMAEINKELNNNARVITKTAGAVENGDVVKIDFAGFMDGVAFEGGTATEYTLEIGSKTFIDTFEEQLIGAEIGKEIEVNVTFPEGYQNNDLSGKPALFKVTVKEISTKELPALDDDFAASVSEFDTLDAYKKDLHEKLTKTKAENAEQIKESKVLRKLIDEANLEVPQVMIENRISQMVEDFSAQIGEQGLKLDEYLSFFGQTMETLRTAYAPEAKVQVHGRLILEAIGKAENFEISDEEFDSEVARVASMYGMETAQLKSVMRSEDIAGIKEDIATQKALKFISENAKEV